MRVALLSWDYPPGVTGLGRAASEIAAGLTEAGADVEVFALDRTGTEEADGVLVHGHRIAPESARGRLRPQPVIGHHVAPARFARAVRERHAARPFDVVECTNWYAPAAHLTGALPLLVRLSTPAAAVPRPSTLPRRLDLAYAHRMETRMVRAASHRVSNTAPHAERMTEHYGLDGLSHEVIELSLDPRVVASGRACPPPTGEPELLFVGRAEHRKGFDAVLGAHAALRAAMGEDAPRLTLIGLSPGDLEREADAAGIDASALRGIDDLGRVDDAALDAAYARAHAVLAPSRYESYGLVYREAAAYGRPVIACAVDPSASDFIARTGAGVLAPRCEGPALAQTIRALLSDAAAQARARAGGLAAAAALSRRALGEATLRAYERAIDSDRSSR